MSILVSIQELSKTHGARPLFDGLSFGLEEGERTGLIGPNGAGKSTLLKILAGLESPDSGNVSSRRGLRAAYVAQHEDFSDLPEDCTVRAALEGVLAALPLEKYEREHRYEAAMEAAAFPDAGQQLRRLSGGWKKRLAILRGALTEPELLLLDEPTNHMDLEGVLWLEKWVGSWEGSLVVVTHDRRFLEKVCNRVIEISPRYEAGFFSSSGNYSRFLEKREELFAGQRSQQDALGNHVRREIEWLRRGAKARTTKQQARIQRAGESMDALEDLAFRNSQNRAVTIDFSGSQRRTKILVETQGVAKAMGGRKLFGPLDLVLGPGTKLGLLGANGSGKSTLLRVLTGELAPDGGLVKQAEKLSVVIFDQHREQLDLSQTLRQALCPAGDQVNYRGQFIHLMAWSKRFLFQPGQLELPLSKLSGGEQARVLIARLMLKPADVLLLDEPTNDLDLASLEVLEQGLLDFPGALVLVTHDRYLLDRVSDRILALDGKGNAAFFADFDQWEAHRAAGAKASARGPELAGKVAEAGAGAAAASEGAEAARRLTGSERNELKTIEARIAEAEGDASRAKQALEVPAVASDAAELMKRHAAMEEADAKVAALYARWDALEKKKTGG